MRDSLVGGAHLSLGLLEYLSLELWRLLTALVEAVYDVGWPLEGGISLRLETTLILTTAWLATWLRYGNLLLWIVGWHSARKVLVLSRRLWCSLAKTVTWLDLLWRDLLIWACQLLSLTELVRAQTTHFILSIHKHRFLGFVQYWVLKSILFVLTESLSVLSIWHPLRILLQLGLIQSRLILFLTLQILQLIW